MTDKIYIILPVHNRREITQCFIECLKAQTYQNYHLILVDDGSTDGTEEMVRSKVRSLTVIKGKGDWWWAGGLQQGINWLKHNDVQASDIVLMVNDDITFDHFFLERAVNLLKVKQPGLLTAQVFEMKTGRLFSMLSKANIKNLTFKKADSPEEINCCDTRALFTRFSDLIQIGDFYPKFLPHYLSDCEFTIRAYQKGFKIYVHPELKALINETIQYSESNFFENAGFITFIKKYFSNKYPGNPIAWTAFAVIVSPNLFIPLNLARIWKEAIYKIIKHSWGCFISPKSINKAST